MRTQHISSKNSSGFQNTINNTLERLEEDNKEIVSISHGAGVGHAMMKGPYTTTSNTKTIYSALIMYREEIKND
jgi:hypothetical protein